LRYNKKKFIYLISPPKIDRIFYVNLIDVLKQKKVSFFQLRLKKVNLKKKLNSIYEKHTGQSLSVIEKMMERDYFMSADDAKKTGIVDKVVSERPDFEKNIKKK